MHAEIRCRSVHALGFTAEPTLGDRAFQSAAPYLWNALPSTIRNIKTLDTFKTAVKTHFFNLAFKYFFYSCLIF